jgi:small subunit ribosomal protein S1
MSIEENTPANGEAVENNLENQEPDAPPVAEVTAAEEPVAVPVEAAESDAAATEPEAESEAAAPLAVSETVAAEETAASAQEEPAPEAAPEPAVSAEPAAAAVTEPAPAEADDEGDDEKAGGDVDFGQILQQFEQEQAGFQEGEVVRGRVVDINDRGVLIDFGYKSEGLVNQAEFTDFAGQLTVQPGDEVDVLVKSMETSEGYPILSRADAMRLKSWDALDKAYQEGSSIKGVVTERIKGGVRVEINGIGAFLPGSLVDVRPLRNLDSLIGQEIEARVIKLNRKRSNVVLSRKALIEDANAGKKQETLANIEEGYIVEGQIKSLTEYGAFVDLGGIDGLLHVTDMSWGRLQNPNEMFKVGDTVQVKVLKLDRDRERVSLGYKHLIPDPWGNIDERYPMGRRLTGKVASVTDYGAFIELESNVEGLVHVSEMSWSKRVKHPSKLVSPGDEVEVQVLGIDPKARRISLGMKQILPNPWDTLHERYNIGLHVKGRVRNLTEFGAFIEVEDGVDGLVHVTDISWNKKVKHPGDVLKKGQEVEAIITSIDSAHRRLSLSIKDLEPSAWDKFVGQHRPGDLVKGTIARIAGFGVFVELDEGLEGLCHVSELSEERVDKPEKAVKVGQAMEFKILRIEPEHKRIGLSARAVNSDEEIVDTKTYSSEAKSGMASLAELSDYFGERE